MGLIYFIPMAGVMAQADQVAEQAIGKITMFQAIVIGLVQGLTEFLPISSTAHIKAIPVLLGWGDPGVALTAVIQLGSIAAILWYFWADLTQVASGMIRAVAKRDYQSTDFRLGLGILLGTLPIVAFGLLLKLLVPNLDESPIRSMGAIAVASIVMALLMGVAEIVGQRKRNFQSLTMRDGIIVGLAQALAIVPGVSRSGSTLTAGLFFGLERSTAARFSFLLGIPAITLAGLVELPTLFNTNLDIIAPLPLAAGLIAALVSSYLAIAWLIKFLQRHSTWVFVWYRLAFGVVILGAIAGQWMQNV